MSEVKAWPGALAPQRTVSRARHHGMGHRSRSKTTADFRYPFLCAELRRLLDMLLAENPVARPIVTEGRVQKIGGFLATNPAGVALHTYFVVA